MRWFLVSDPVRMGRGGCECEANGDAVEQEKLPLNLGWKRSGEVLDAEGVGLVAGMVFDASTIPEILAGDGGAVKRGAEPHGFTRHF